MDGGWTEQDIAEGVDTTLAELYSEAVNEAVDPATLVASWAPVEGDSGPSGPVGMPEPAPEPVLLSSPFSDPEAHFVLEVKPHEPPPAVDEAALAVANSVAVAAADAALAVEDEPAPVVVKKPSRRHSAHIPRSSSKPTSIKPRARSATLSPKRGLFSGRKNGKKEKEEEKPVKKERGRSARRKSATGPLRSNSKPKGYAQIFTTRRSQELPGGYAGMLAAAVATKRVHDHGRDQGQEGQQEEEEEEPGFDRSTLLAAANMPVDERQEEAKQMLQEAAVSAAAAIEGTTGTHVLMAGAVGDPGSATGLLDVIEASEQRLAEQLQDLDEQQQILQLGHAYPLAAAGLGASPRTQPGADLNSAEFWKNSGRPPGPMTPQNAVDIFALDVALQQRQQQLVADVQPTLGQLMQQRLQEATEVQDAAEILRQRMEQPLPPAPPEPPTAESIAASIAAQRMEEASATPSEPTAEDIAKQRMEDPMSLGPAVLSPAEVARQRMDDPDSVPVGISAEEVAAQRMEAAADVDATAEFHELVVRTPAEEHRPGAVAAAAAAAAAAGDREDSHQVENVEPQAAQEVLVAEASSSSHPKQKKKLKQPQHQSQQAPVAGAEDDEMRVQPSAISAVSVQPSAASAPDLGPPPHKSPISPRVSANDIPDTPSELIRRSASTSSLQQQQPATPAPRAGVSGGGVSTSTGAGDYVTARVERSKHIAQQLARLQEESKRLQEQSKALQARAAEFQTEMGLKPLQMPVEAMVLPPAAPPPQQQHHHQHHQSPLAAAVMQEPEGHSRHPPASTSATPSEHNKRGSASGAAAAAKSSSGAAGGKNKGKGKTGSSQSSSSKQKLTPLPAPVSAPEKEPHRRKRRSVASGEPGAAAGSRNSAADSNAASREHHRKPPLAAPLPPLVVSDSPDREYTAASSSTPPPAAAINWALPKRGAPPGQKGQSRYSDSSILSVQQQSRAVEGGKRQTSAASTVEPPLPKWSDQVNSAANTPMASPKLGRSPSNRISQAGGVSASSPGPLSKLPPVDDPSWGPEAGHKSFSEGSGGGASGQRRFLPSLQLPPTLAAVVAEREQRQKLAETSSANAAREVALRRQQAQQALQEPQAASPSGQAPVLLAWALPGQQHKQAIAMQLQAQQAQQMQRRQRELQEQQAQLQAYQQRFGSAEASSLWDQGKYAAAPPPQPPPPPPPRHHEGASVSGSSGSAGSRPGITWQVGAKPNSVSSQPQPPPQPQQPQSPAPYGQISVSPYGMMMHNPSGSNSGGGAYGPWMSTYGAGKQSSMSSAPVAAPMQPMGGYMMGNGMMGGMGGMNPMMQQQQMMMGGGMWGGPMLGMQLQQNMLQRADAIQQSQVNHYRDVEERVINKIDARKEPRAGGSHGEGGGSGGGGGGGARKYVEKEQPAFRLF